MKEKEMFCHSEEAKGRNLLNILKVYQKTKEGWDCLIVLEKLKISAGK